MERHLPAASQARGEAWTVEVASLPGRHWKWRMHSAALTMVERMKASGLLHAPVDLFLVTDMLDVGQFRAALPPDLRGVPIALYFHENQLTFPDHPERPPEAWDRHYAFLNLTSALLADVVWFNSEYHRKVFLEAIPGFLRQLPSPRPVQPELKIKSKSAVLPIGLEADVLEPRTGGRFEDGPPVIAWNHRWEHDKGPGAFLNLLQRVRDRGVPFRLAIMGEAFQSQPEAFDVMRSEFKEAIVHWGHAPSRHEYLDLLASCDVALVTAHHDFYGISVLESAALGLEVVAPRELAYPDHFPEDWLHDRKDLEDALVSALSAPARRAWSDCAQHRSWSSIADAWCNAVTRVHHGK